ncbi:unnamed protein product [Mytilus coruscus]|uniref:XIAP n=1 Tax=Mytilus coruscus TaxID=42192 RepID=A0A6J8F1C3_MYTCO|nr:unnamed protein product [Mytilus coruscus]
MRLLQYSSPLERQASYINWPVHSRFSRNQLVQAGFTYTGTEHIVRCFTCDYTASANSWIPPENPSEAHARCSPECSFVLGIKMCPTFNTSWINKYSFTDSPIHTDSIVPVTDTSPTYRFTDESLQRLQYPQFENVMSRIQSYTNVSKQRPKLLAEAGYFYTGEADIVRCFCCGIGLAEWNHQDEPWVQHAKHSFKCSFLIREKGVDYVNDQQTRWKKIYNPKHPALEDKDSRLKTFAGVWRTDIEQTPEILVDAGFFYTGEEDVVRCHYCDGGLRHWDPGEIPWEEHARWFPFWIFLIKMKGREYIEDIKRKTEEGQRPESTVSTVSQLPCLPAHRIYLKEVEEEKDLQKIKETNRQLKEKMKCIRCRTNDICMLFVNCGHRKTCEECADLMDFCPFCDTRIKKRLKTFLS